MCDSQVGVYSCSFRLSMTLLVSIFLVNTDVGSKIVSSDGILVFALAKKG